MAKRGILLQILINTVLSITEPLTAYIENAKSHISQGH